MKHATLTSLGGELIEASGSDYSDYRRLLRCPNCGEPVFWRSGYLRDGLEVQPTFVHHKAVPEVSACESRVGAYSKSEIERRAGEARGQRISHLRLYMWRFIRSGLAVDVMQFAKSVHLAKLNEQVREVVAFAMDNLEINIEFMTGHILNTLSDAFMTGEGLEYGNGKTEQSLRGLTGLRRAVWPLHLRITKEAMGLFLQSPTMAELRRRLCCCLCDPRLLEAYNPQLLDLDMATDEWREMFAKYLMMEVAMQFLTVDWVGIWEEKS